MLGNKYSKLTMRLCMPLMVGLYPLLCTSVLATLQCVHIEGTYERPESQWVVASQPYLACLGPQHIRAAVLAVMTLVVFVVGFPVGTFAYLHWHREKWRPVVVQIGNQLETRGVTAEGPRDGVTVPQASDLQVPQDWHGFRTFLQSDFRSNVYWVKHAHMALNFTFACTFVLLSDGLPWQQVARVTLNLASVAGSVFLLVRYREWEPICADAIARVTQRLTHCLLCF